MKKTPQVDGFINSVSEDEIIAELNSMKASSVYLTEPVYRGNAEKWPGNQISFVDFHLTYLKLHPSLDPHHYMANLRLTLKKRP
ncbi:hypothetical protein HYW35_01610 [Candidatus Saccharibacteria bacterium]|nr:hypothetical protein [Candidatus Saccharibacteria bacterium]